MTEALDTPITAPAPARDGANEEDMPNNYQPTSVLEPARPSSGVDLGGSQSGCGLIADEGM